MKADGDGEKRRGEERNKRRKARKGMFIVDCLHGLLLLPSIDIPSHEILKEATTTENTPGREGISFTLSVY
jgi:hypothetical protein